MSVTVRTSSDYLPPKEFQQFTDVGCRWYLLFFELFARWKFKNWFVCFLHSRTSEGSIKMAAEPHSETHINGCRHSRHACVNTTTSLHPMPKSDVNNGALPTQQKTSAFLLNRRTALRLTMQTPNYTIHLGLFTDRLQLAEGAMAGLWELGPSDKVKCNLKPNRMRKIKKKSNIPYFKFGRMKIK